MGALVILFVSFVVLTHVHVPVFSITPGNAESVAPNITVSGLNTDSHRDRIMLTDVYVNPLTAMGWLLAHLDSHAQLVDQSQILSPGVPVQELDNQGYVDMANSKDYARTAALRALGWTITASAVGAEIYQIAVPSSASRAGLNVGDRVVSMNGRSVRSTCDLIRDVHVVAPNTLISLGVVRASITGSGTITYGATQTLKLKTFTAPAGLGPSGCSNDSAPARSIIGVGLQDAIVYASPGSISIATPDIGGPSAGLSMTLALIDRLSAGSLTGFHAIAATGTIDAAGNVGDVGGVAQKTIAVQNAGATVFIVPQSEVATAKSASDGKLLVLGVNTLKDALRDLRRLGGQLPIPLTKPYPLYLKS